MISPSESYGKRVVAAGAPVRLLGEGIREVSRLEFYPLAVPEIQIEVEQTSDAALLREEVATLGGRLRSQ